MIFRILLGERAVPVILMDIQRPEAVFDEFIRKLKERITTIQKNDTRVQDKLDIIAVDAQPYGWEITLYFKDKTTDTVTFWIQQEQNPPKVEIVFEAYPQYFAESPSCIQK
jgi:hypothetical protein